MNYDEQVKYWFPARAALVRYRGGSPWDASRELGEMLGTGYSHPNYFKYITLTPRHRRILEQLAGPHGEAVYKAFRAQRAKEQG